MGNQQPSSFKIEKVQRLSFSREYIQVNGRAQHPKKGEDIV